MPEGVTFLNHDAILTYEEILRLIRIFASLGINRIRLTGGEPLVRQGITNLAKEIKQIPGIEYLAITTNGIGLSQLGEELKNAGVDGLNISLDTMNPLRFEQLTQRDKWNDVWEGIQAAIRLNFSSIKINSVLSPNSIESDWLSVIRVARDYPIDVRLIEWMPLNQQEAANCTMADNALDRIQSVYGPLKNLPKETKGGPADYYQLEAFLGRIGIIHAMSNCFCDGCNRISLTSTGVLKLCLFYEVGTNLKTLLRDGSTDKEIREILLKTVAYKPLKHRGVVKSREDEHEKSHIGTIAHSKGMFDIGG